MRQATDQTTGRVGAMARQGMEMVRALVPFGSYFRLMANTWRWGWVPGRSSATFPGTSLVSWIPAAALRRGGNDPASPMGEIAPVTTAPRPPLTRFHGPLYRPHRMPAPYPTTAPTRRPKDRRLGSRRKINSIYDKLPLATKTQPESIQDQLVRRRSDQEVRRRSDQEVRRRSDQEVRRDSGSVGRRRLTGGGRRQKRPLTTNGSSEKSVFTRRRGINLKKSHTKVNNPY